jgi:hypothetical protein
MTASIIELPEREAPESTLVSNKKVYETDSKLNRFTNSEGEECYVSFESLRILSISVRDYTLDGKGRFFRVEHRFVADNPQVGRIINNQKVPHALFTEQRYSQWASEQLPKRFQGGQWMPVEQNQLLMDYFNYLRSAHNYAIDRDAPPPPNSQATRNDFLRARSTQPRDPSNPRAYGIPVDAIEVSINPTYERGFVSFWDGLEEQLERIETAAAMPAEDAQQKAVRDQAFQNLMLNVHSLSGVYHNEEDMTTWPRSVDVGSVTIDGKAFPLYNNRGAELSDADFAEILAADSKTTAAGSAPLDLTLDSVDAAGAENDDEQPF